MGYLSGSILLSLRLRMGPPGQQRNFSAGVQPAHRFMPCNGKRLPTMSSRNVAVCTKLG
jgi:hypothetical protein